MFYQYEFCPHWIWFDNFGDQKKKGELNELFLKLLEQGVAHEEDYIKDKYFEEVPITHDSAAVETTLDLMRRGVETIYQGELRGEVDGNDWVGRPDLLVRKRGKSDLGDFHYEAVDIKSGKSLKKVHKMQLTFYSILLEQIQGIFPKKAAIINLNHETLEFSPKEFRRKFNERKKIIEKILDGEKPELVLTRMCLQGPWKEECKAQAEKANDISLLYNVDRRALSLLRKAGIKTVDDAALADIDSLPKIPFMNHDRLERMIVQAESLSHGETRVLKTPEIPEDGLLLHFDIEGDPLLGVEYLFGFLDEKTDKYSYFIAEKPEDEKKMWKQFLKWLKTLPDEYTVYHYAPYEKSRMTTMEEKYGGSKELDQFKENLFDLFAVVKESIVFPLCFYSVKDICKHLGFFWSHKKAGGAQSIFWYEQWLESGDRKILEDIIQYNEDDVRATVFLKKWLQDQYASGLSHK